MHRAKDHAADLVEDLFFDLEEELRAEIEGDTLREDWPYGRPPGA